MKTYIQLNLNLKKWKAIDLGITNDLSIIQDILTPITLINIWIYFIYRGNIQQCSYNEKDE